MPRPPRRSCASRRRSGWRGGAFGAGYDAVQTHEILERMFLWLAGPEGRAAALARPSGLLELAARAAHPAIADGPGLRGASHWAAFVDGAARAWTPAAGLVLSGNVGRQSR